MKKRILIITGILVLVLGVGGLWGYDKYFKPDPVIQQQLTTQFGADFFDPFAKDKEVKNSGPVNTVQPSADITTKKDLPVIGSILQKVRELETSAIVTPSTPVKETILEQPMTQDDINNKYKPKFNYLQNVALGRLDTLYSAASQEYAQGKKAGTLNASELIQKYIQAGTMLEANVDSQFYSTLNALQAELIANNLSTDIVGAYKSDYEKAKSSKRSQFLAKARK